MKRCVVALAALAACGKSKPGQTYKDAVDIVCHVDDAPGFAAADPAERPAIMSAWATEKVTNKDALALIETMGTATGAARRGILREAVTQAGLDTCPVFELLAPWPVPDAGAADLDTLDARAAVALEPGKVFIDDREIALADLGERMKQLASIRPGTLTVILDPATPFGLLLDVIDVVRAHYFRFALVARRDDGERGIVPLVLPDPEAPPDPPGLEGMVVGISGAELTVFSTSGMEGTVANPLVRAPLSDLRAAQGQVQDALGVVVDRRWRDKARTAAAKRIVVLASDDVPASAFVPVIAAVRRAGAKELYPNVVLRNDLVAQLEEGREAPTGPFRYLDVASNADTSLTPEIVRAKIESAYAAGIKKCGEGRAMVAFTVKRNGKVVDSRGEGEDPAVVTCLTTLVKSWRFAPAVDADGDMREPEITVTVELGDLSEPEAP